MTDARVASHHVEVLTEVNPDARIASHHVEALVLVDPDARVASHHIEILYTDDLVLVDNPLEFFHRRWTGKHLIPSDFLAESVGGDEVEILGWWDPVSGTIKDLE